MSEKEKEFEVLKLPIEENVCYKGMKYVVKHTYKNSGENLINVLKSQLLKTLANVENTAFLCYNKEVNIFGK